MSTMLTTVAPATACLSAAPLALLNLSHNQIGPEGCRILAPALAMRADLAVGAIAMRVDPAVCAFAPCPPFKLLAVPWLSEPSLIVGRRSPSVPVPSVHSVHSLIIGRTFTSVLSVPPLLAVPWLSVPSLIVGKNRKVAF